MDGDSEERGAGRQGLPSVFSADGPIFGRDLEAAAFNETLVSAQGSGMTVLSVGQVGMGKTTLLRKFARVAAEHPSLECTARDFVLREQDDPDTFLDTLVHETFAMVRAADGRSLLAGPNWKKQVTALFGVVHADKLFESLLGREWKPSWQSLLHLFTDLSKEMAANRRLIFFIDPSKYLRQDSASAWLAVVERLPPKFMLVFAQRPDDCLARCPDFLGPTIRRIPDHSLPALDSQAAEAFIHAGLEELSTDTIEAANALRRYGGWPYAIRAGLLLLKRGVTPADLPADPDQLAQRLLSRLATGPTAERAIAVVYALAILEVPVTLAILTDFLGESSSSIRMVLGGRDVVGLVDKGPQGYKLFHSLFADQVRAQIKEDGEWTQMHNRVISLFKARLAKDPRDELALCRLSFHVREGRGLESYFAIVQHLFKPKYTLGMLADTIRELEFALSQAEQPELLATFSGHLGILYKTRGDLDKAEAMYEKSLAINEALGRKEGMANQYGHLGILYKTRGDLDKAEAMYQKALAIEEALGCKEGMATQYGHLGNLYLTRGDLDKAEAMYQKALAIEEALGRKEGMASDYGNLGNLYLTRGDLDKAEAMYQKALAIDEALGRKEGMASDYRNLGILYMTRGDLDKAAAMWTKSLALFQQLGNRLKSQIIEGWLLDLERRRGK